MLRNKENRNFGKIQICDFYQNKQMPQTDQISEIAPHTCASELP